MKNLVVEHNINLHSKTESIVVWCNNENDQTTPSLVYRETTYLKWFIVVVVLTYKTKWGNIKQYRITIRNLNYKNV